MAVSIVSICHALFFVSISLAGRTPNWQDFVPKNIIKAHKTTTTLPLEQSESSTVYATPKTPVVSLSCLKSKQCLHIEDVAYGEDCGPKGNSLCHDPTCFDHADFKYIVDNLCGEKLRCMVSGNRTSFPETCEDKNRTLRIKYRCSSDEKDGKLCNRAPKEFAKRIKSGRTREIRCEGGNVKVDILSALYEKTDENGRLVGKRLVLDEILQQCPRKSGDKCFIKSSSSDKQEILSISYECFAVANAQPFRSGLCRVARTSAYNMC